MQYNTLGEILKQRKKTQPVIALNKYFLENTHKSCHRQIRICICYIHPSGSLTGKNRYLYVATTGDSCLPFEALVINNGLSIPYCVCGYYCFPMCKGVTDTMKREEVNVDLLLYVHTVPRSCWNIVNISAFPLWYYRHKPWFTKTDDSASLQHVIYCILPAWRLPETIQWILHRSI